MGVTAPERCSWALIHHGGAERSTGSATDETMDE